MNHVTPDVDNLSSPSPYTCMDRVSIGNGERVSISHVGSSSMVSGSRLFYLRNVLHVPTVCENLLFVGQFANDNLVYFKFHPYLCFVKDIQTGKVLLVGHIHKGLYRFDVSTADSFKSPAAPRVNSMSMCNTSRISVPLLWHQWLGHPCNSVLSKVLRSCNISFKNNYLPSVCSTCQLGKSHKLSFSTSTTVYFVPFELVVSDV